MYALILNNEIVQIELNTFPVAAPLIWVQCPDNCTLAWTYANGVFTAPIAPTLTFDEQMKPYRDEVNTALYQTAQSKQYDNQLSIVTYINSSNTQWKAEANAFITWRDALFAYAINIENQVQSNSIPAPTLESFIAGFPTITWP